MQKSIVPAPVEYFDGGRAPAVAVVSTYPPTSCGLATFAASLTRGLRANGTERIGVVRCLQDSSTGDPEGPVLEWTPDVDWQLPGVASFLDDFDFVFLQHEYGIFGSDDGRAVLDLMDAVNVPVIPTLHTVPSHPTERQREILEGVVARSAACVVMTEAAHDRLCVGFDVDSRKIRIIPHGASRLPADVPSGQGPGYVLTWGLLGPGKGIEWVVDALAMAPLSGFQIEYRVVGRTHPKVAARDGSAYIDMLRERASRLGVSERVLFDETYHSLDTLLDIVSRARVVVLPYESDDQITSGVLVDAIAAGVPVVATSFPHARELLSDGAGIVVPQRDAAALARAIHSVVSNPRVRSAMAYRAGELAVAHDWSTVASNYLEVGQEMMSDVAAGFVTGRGGAS